MHARIHLNNVRSVLQHHPLCPLVSAILHAALLDQSGISSSDSAADRAESQAACIVAGNWQQLLYSDIVLFELPDQSCIGTLAIVRRACML